MRGLLIAVASIVVEKQQGAWVSVVVAHGLSSYESPALER